MMDLGFVFKDLAIDWRWGFREREMCQGFPITHVIKWMNVGAVN